MKKKKKKINIIDKNNPYFKKFWIPSDNILDIIDIDKSLDNTWFSSIVRESMNKNEYLVDNLSKIDYSDNQLRCKKIELFPTKKQKKILNNWSNIYRYYYNQTIKYTKRHNIYNFYKLRSMIKKNTNKDIKYKINKSKIPSHTIDNAIHDVCKAFKSAIENLKAGNIKFFRLRYKKQKSPRQTIALESSCFSICKETNKCVANYKKLEDKNNDPESYIKYLFGFKIKDDIVINKDKLKNSFCTSIFGKYFNTSESIKEINHDVRLSFHQHRNKFFLFVPYEKINKIDHNQNDICSLDPGKRVFQTCYCSNEIIEIGNDCSKRLEKEFRRLDRYTKLRNKKYCYKKKYHQIENKIENLIDELHYKTCNYLCKRYKCIMIGKLSTKDTNCKKTSKLNSMTKRILSRLSHYRFRMRLKSKCEEYGVKYLEVDEGYTSKTCGWCGTINNNLGANKVFSCNSCKIVIDRDINGARNILIKNYDKI